MAFFSTSDEYDMRTSRGEKDPKIFDDVPDCLDQHLLISRSRTLKDDSEKLLDAEEISQHYSQDL